MRAVKDKWYGDKRDLVKWGVLLQLANRYAASRILQVAYYRPEAITTRSETIEIDSRKCAMPDAVYMHFRNMADITRLSSPSLQIQVVNSVWNAEGRASGAYIQEVEAARAQLPTDSPCIVFLDPDTGLEPPKGNPKLEHVLESELKQIWEEAVRVNDVLVFYQHKAGRKKGESWITAKREQFESALGLGNGAPKLARGEAATDVVFFFAQKSRATDRTTTVENVCPECERKFKGNGFDGIDAHWRARHEHIMPYKEAWPLIKSGNYHR
ncbi:MAG TPA: hypothetical protein VG204_03235 [Terriglobia bacterium]|nr:hypothetical protein [Terriglobia bacterium]